MIHILKKNWNTDTGAAGILAVDGLDFALTADVRRTFGVTRLA